MPDLLNPAPFRLGTHGAADLPRSIVEATGRTERDVRWVRYGLEDPFRGLREGDMDLMIAKYELREPDLRSSGPVAWDGRAAVLGARHPLAGRDEVMLEELAEFDAFCCPEGFPAYVWDCVVPPRTPLGTAIRRVHRMKSVSAMVELLRTTNAVHLSFASLASAVPSDVHVVPIADLPPAPVVLCWSAERALSEAAAAFVADAEEAVHAHAR
jgi:DNA-binding transcriptional LysR family regulator